MDPEGSGVAGVEPGGGPPACGSEVGDSSVGGPPAGGSGDDEEPYRSGGWDGCIESEGGGLLKRPSPGERPSRRGSRRYASRATLPSTPVVGRSRFHRGYRQGWPNGCCDQIRCAKVWLSRMTHERMSATLPHMCGIVGYVGNRPALSIVLDGLRGLEYRGYDSAGVAVIVGDAVLTEKRAGKLANLEKALVERSADGIGAGTTGI